MKFRTQKVKKNGKEYLFVTRTRSKKMSQGEIKSYFKETGHDGKPEIVEEPQKQEEKEEVKTVVTWQIPDDRQRHRMFLSDLKLGLAFCAKKYNVTEDQIVNEARRVAPHFNTGVLK